MDLARKYREETMTITSESSGCHCVGEMFPPTIWPAPQPYGCVSSEFASLLEASSLGSPDSLDNGLDNFTRRLHRPHTILYNRNLTNDDAVLSLSWSRMSFSLRVLQEVNQP